MSEALRLYKVENRGSIADIANTVTKMQGFDEFLEATKGEQLDTYAEIELVEEMIKILFCNPNIDELVISFLTMSSKLNLKLPELYELYIGKNILNKFRQDHGYKTGSYIKEWQGKEDNVIMQEILASKSDITPEALYATLAEAYPNG